jgi:type II secretory pathway pseudopilin PulG
MRVSESSRTKMIRDEMVRQNGFSLLAVLFAVAIFGVLSSAAIQTSFILTKQEKETELLFIGGQFQNALKSYAAATPTGTARYPKNLEDLLKDPRFPGIRRHLRKIYIDPVTRNSDWILIKNPSSNEIIGISSSSKDRSLKIANFPDRFPELAGKTTYFEWIFYVDTASVVRQENMKMR